MRTWLQLARISNLPTVWTNVTAAWLLAGGALQDSRLAWLLLAGSLLYTGGMFLNDAADAPFDREHRPERPIPRRQIGLQTAWISAVVMLLAGATLAVVVGANPRVTALLVAAIVFYDLYHKQWAGSVVIMGACRALLYLMAASASLEAALPAALAMGSYVVGISLAARLEQKGTAVPVVTTVVAFGLLYTPAIVFVGRAAATAVGPAHIFVLAVYAIWVAHASHLLRRGGAHVGGAVGLLLAGIVIVDALAVAAISVPAAFTFVALAPLLLLWQRHIAAT